MVRGRQRGSGRVTWYCRTVQSPGCGAAWANGRRRSAEAKSSATTGYAVPTYRVVPTPAATSALLERHPFLFLPALHPGLALNVCCATTCRKDGLPQRLVPPRVDACSLDAGAAMAAVKLSSPAVLTCSSNHGGQSRSKNSRQRIADGFGQVVKIKSAEASLRWRLQKKFAGSLDLRSNAGQCWSSIRWIVCRTSSAKATTEVGLEQADSSAADSVEAVEAVDSETQGEDDYPANYVLVSNNPDDLQKEIQKIEAENEELRKIIATSNAEAAEIGLLLRDTTVDVSRPRAGIQAPTANGVDAVSKPVPIQAPTAEAPVQAPTAEGVDTVAIPAPTETPILPRTTVGDEAVSSYDRLQSAKLARSDVEESTKRTTNPFNIVFVSSEVSPYSKTGGLGDVCGALPLALAGRGHRVMVISPRYMNGVTDDQYAGAFDCQCRIKVDCFGGQQEVAFFHEYRDGVDWVFVDHPSYHRPGNPYGDTRGAFGDNQFRFTLLCHAACEAPLVLPLGGFTYGDKCLFIANDWHAGLVPVLLAAKYRKHGVYLGARCILAIHNLAHQGVEPGTTFSNLGLPLDWYGALEWVFPTWARKHALDKGEAVNIMKGAIVTSDRILTVSQGYAWEITTSEGGWGMDGLLRSRNAVLNGITNGVDVNEWNPATDRHISSQYVVDDLVGKAECKAALQKELGLPVRPEVPMIGFIGRLDYQKGPDVIQAGLPELMTDDVQMIMLGSGDPDVESWMGWAENNYRDKFRGWVGFSVPVAHRITAGCDILLMPSRFEPCGLNQLYAMRYGTVPVVHCTGGLRDTVQDYNPLANGGQGAGTGWTFSPLTKEAMMRALWIAIATYRNDKEAWLRIMKRGMSQDFSWEKAALQYEQVFEWAMIDPPYA